MCFSATASFASTGLLVPLGITALWRSCRNGRTDLWPLALMPLGFGLQQALEGLVWLGLNQGSLSAPPRLEAMLYLFFALACWPIWIPFMALRLSDKGAAIWGVDRGRRRLLLALQGCGLVMAVALWLPLLLQPERIEPVVVNGSINYGLRLLLSGGVAGVVPAVYAVVVTGPLLLLPSAPLRSYGIALLISGVISEWFYRHAFASVWCYFSAVLAGLVVWMVWTEPRFAAAPVHDVSPSL